MWHRLQQVAWCPCYRGSICPRSGSQLRFFQLKSAEASISPLEPSGAVGEFQGCRSPSSAQQSDSRVLPKSPAEGVGGPFLLRLPPRTDTKSTVLYGYGSSIATRTHPQASFRPSLVLRLCKYLVGHISTPCMPHRRTRSLINIDIIGFMDHCDCSSRLSSHGRHPTAQPLRHTSAGPPPFRHFCACTVRQTMFQIPISWRQCSNAWPFCVASYGAPCPAASRRV